jgi:hypothetical protein
MKLLIQTQNKKIWSSKRGPGEECFLVERELVLGGRHEAAARVGPRVDRVDRDRAHWLIHLDGRHRSTVTLKKARRLAIFSK